MKTINDLQMNISFTTKLCINVWYFLYFINLTWMKMYTYQCQNCHCLLRFSQIIFYFLINNNAFIFFYYHYPSTMHWLMVYVYIDNRFIVNCSSGCPSNCNKEINYFKKNKTSHLLKRTKHMSRTKQCDIKKLQQKCSLK